MRVGLHDAEREYLKHKKFPNYALMKISAYHKARGDSVEWWDPITSHTFDLIYSSKVFDFTPENPYLPPSAIRAGPATRIFRSIRRCRRKLTRPFLITAYTPNAITQ